MVIIAIAHRLQDGATMQRWLSRHMPIGEVPARLKALSLLATAICSAKQNHTAQIRQILGRVTVSKTSLDIRLSKLGLSQALNIPQNKTEQTCHTVIRDGEEVTHVNITPPPNLGSEETPLLITMNSHLLRSGSQVKLILGNEKNQPTAPNPRLVAMVAKTRNWFDGLKSGRYPTIKDIALEEKCDKSYVGRLMSIAFLAPDIVELILTANHSPALTPERLRKACPLPLRWEDQRAMLLH